MHNSEKMKRMFVSILQIKQIYIAHVHLPCPQDTYKCVLKRRLTLRHYKYTDL